MRKSAGLRGRALQRLRRVFRAGPGGRRGYSRRPNAHWFHGRLERDNRTWIWLAHAARGSTLAAGPLTAGQAFGPRYHIIRVLGAGGMGVVYQAWDAELGVAVALKVIRPEVLHDIESAREVERRFKRELVLARQVTHKHVVRIHDLGELDGIKYLTMPFIEGENLADRLRRQGKLSVPQSLAIAKQIATGLEAAHEVGVVHRDLKPENIMISSDDCALIMDFGISRSVGGATTGTATALGAVIGTLEYMAPEQAQGQPVDHRADIYSFGLLVYDTLVGRQRLAARDNAMSEMMGRMQLGPPPLRTIDAAIPEPFERIVSRCLQPEAEARYATTTALVHGPGDLTPDGHQLAPPVGRGIRRQDRWRPWPARWWLSLPASAGGRRARPRRRRPSPSRSGAHREFPERFRTSRCSTGWSNRRSASASKARRSSTRTRAVTRCVSSLS